MTEPGASGPRRPVRVTIAPATLAVTAGLVAAAGVLFAPLDVVYALLVGWVVTLVTLIAVRGR